MMSAIERLTAMLSERYRIERELGAGGMATVYLAHDLKHDRQVAIKVLLPELSASLGAERFIREIRWTARLSHPHILPLLDSGVGTSASETDTVLYYVMPFIEGESLRKALDRDGVFGLDRARTVTRQVAAALDYAHRRASSTGTSSRRTS
jgi:serine/threonine-protein kinase